VFDAWGKCLAIPGEIGHCLISGASALIASCA
jgi:hypothetical protein